MTTKKRKKPVRKSSGISRKDVDPRVWKKALQLSKRNLKRIEIISSEDVIVWNHDIK